MKKIFTRLFVILMTICISVPSLNISLALAIDYKKEYKLPEVEKIDEIIYERPKFFASTNSRSVTEFTYHTDSDLYYTVIKSASGSSRGTVKVRGNNNAITSISIPNTVEDNEGNLYDVTTIGSRGFSGYKSLRSITIPENVEYIESSAFMDCVKLETIRIWSPRLTLYNNAFRDIASNPTFYVVNHRVEDELLEYLDEDDVDIIITDEYYDDDDLRDGYHRVNLEAEKGGSVSGGGTYKKNETVHIKATAKTDYEFDRWVVDYGDVSLDDRYDRSTYFKMPDERVTITAQFDYVGDDSSKRSSSSKKNSSSSSSTNSSITKDDKISLSLDNFFGDENQEQEDIVINLGNSTNVSTSEFEKVRGKNANIIFVLNGYKWTINGKNVATNILDKGYCDLGVTFKQAVDNNILSMSQNTAIAQFDLNYIGDLPFQGMLEFSPKEVLPKQPVYMYSYNSSANNIKYKDYDIADDNGIVQLDIDHNSTYLLTDRIIQNTYVVQKTDVKTVDLENIIPYYESGEETSIVLLSGRDGNNITFVAPETTVYKYTNNDKGFEDIANHWANSSIKFVSARNLFNGVSETEFAPDDTITRGMFITALGNLNQVDTTWYDTGNNDVYYAPYTQWASDSGILNGLENTNFDEPITREEMAVIFKNYSDYIGFSLPSAKNSTGFDDDEQISSWAKEAVSSIKQLGIINGKENNNFKPEQMATRAEASVMFKRFIESMLNQSIQKAI